MTSLSRFILCYTVLCSFLSLVFAPSEFENIDWTIGRQKGMNLKNIAGGAIPEMKDCKPKKKV